MTDQEHIIELRSRLWATLYLECDSCNDATLTSSPWPTVDPVAASFMFHAQGWQSIGDKIYCPHCAAKVINQSHGKKK
jgi:hypothetical protein